MSCPQEKIWEPSKRERFLWQPTIQGLGKPQKPLSLQSYNAVSEEPGRLLPFGAESAFFILCDFVVCFDGLIQYLLYC